MKKTNVSKLMVVVLTILLAASVAQPAVAKTSLPAPAMGSIPYFRYPVVGIGEGVSYEIGSLKHTGPDYYAIDFSYKYEGIDVYPTLPGRVVWVGYEKDYGWTVVIRHWDDSKWDKKYYSIYAHLTGSGLPKLWDIVDGTRPIGKMGKSGNGANGVVHLHFAVRSSDKVYDGVTALYGKDGYGNIVTPAFNVRKYLH